MERSASDLLIVMPVYNEETAIVRVVTEWVAELSRHHISWSLLLIDDGSRDGTPHAIDALASEFGSRVQVVHQKNRGHGQSCLRGYRAAIERGFAYVMQIDSDWQCDPRFFGELWSRRHTFDVIYGRRVRRDDGRRRQFASFVLKLLVRLRTGARCVDPNVPYRLMRTSVLPLAIDRIPADFFLANVALAVLLARESQLRHGTVPIHFRNRDGGSPSVRLGQFVFRARQLSRQLGQLGAAPMAQ